MVSIHHSGGGSRSVLPSSAVSTTMTKGCGDVTPSPVPPSICQLALLIGFGLGQGLPRRHRSSNHDVSKHEGVCKECVLKRQVMNG